MRSITTWTFKPSDPLKLAARYRDLEGTALLYSGGCLDSAQNSFLCLFPDDKISLHAKTGVWEELEKKISPFKEDEKFPQWVGYLGYEMGFYSDPDLEMPSWNSFYPDCIFYRPTVVVHFDHKTNRATLFSKKPVSLDRDSLPEKDSDLSFSFKSDTLESYLDKIARIKEWILDGEIYQVNLSQEFHLEGSVTPFKYFQEVTRINPAPFSAFLNCGSFSIVSSSPERFLKKERNFLETRPIKGTKPRGRTLFEDHALKEELLRSEKEKAELLMITDLLRNDLGKVSLPGTVSVEKIWHCEAYTNVFHLLSIIKSTCFDFHPIQILKSLFPGGSITGCPKLRAMKAIAELEKRPRGIYTGAIGYVAANGDFDFNIAIRTLIVEKNRVQIQLGGGIVIDSDPVKEYEETLHKGRSLFKVLGARDLVMK